MNLTKQRGGVIMLSRISPNYHGNGKCKSVNKINPNLSGGIQPSKSWRTNNCAAYIIMPGIEPMYGNVLREVPRAAARRESRLLFGERSIVIFLVWRLCGGEICVVARKRGSGWL